MPPSSLESDPWLTITQVTLACLAAELRLQPPSDPAAAAALALRFLPAASLFGLLGGFLGASSLAYGALNSLGQTFHSRPPLPLLRARVRQARGGDAHVGRRGRAAVDGARA